VVVDDGSTDGTEALLRDVTWATVLRQPNAGAASARNRGWRQATAPVVAFLDDDCTPGPGWPLGLLDAFSAPEVVGVGGRVDGDHDGALSGYVAAERLVGHGRDLPDGDVDYLITANAAFRRRALEEVDGFDEDFPGAAGEDVDLSWRLRAAGGRLVRSEVAVAHAHRTSPGEIVRTYRAHGRARAILDRRHPARRSRAAVGGAVGPAAWSAAWRRYRHEGIGPVGATALLGLRVAGLAAFARGLREGRAA